MPLYELRLTGFQFPDGLDGDKANFRFVVDLRYKKNGNQYPTEHIIMPGMDTYWECDPRKSVNVNYVRDDGSAKFDMEKVSHWGSLIQIVEAESLHSIQFSVFDVDREDVWDKLQKVVGGIFEAAAGKVMAIATAKIPEMLSGPMGKTVDDVTSLAVKKIAGGDKILFRGSRALNGSERESYVVHGDGEPGQDGTRAYKIEFSVAPL